MQQICQEGLAEVLVLLSLLEQYSRRSAGCFIFFLAALLWLTCLLEVVVKYFTHMFNILFCDASFFVLKMNS